MALGFNLIRNVLSFVWWRDFCKKEKKIIYYIDLLKKTYEEKTNIMKEIYVDQINTKNTLKYKVIKQKIFANMIKDINNIKKQLK